VSEDLDRILEQSSKTDLTVLISAKEEAKRKVLAEATPSNLAALDKATRMLEANRMSKAIKEKAAKDKAEKWKTKADVLEYLKKKWAVEKSTFYNHSNPAHRDGGKLNKVKGWYLKTHVDAYAEKYLVPLDGATDDEQSGLQRDKLQGEIRYQTVRSEKAELELDILKGKYLPRDQFDLEMAGRAGVLDNSFNHLIESRAQEIIALVGGDQKKAPEFIHFMKVAKDQMLSEFATTKEFQVIVKPGKTGE
jgi:hypothetical protein